MGELLDRDFQRELLTDLKRLYPHQADLTRRNGGEDDSRLMVNLQYLHEHGLVEFRWQKFVSGEHRMVDAKITARGMDFLAGDGGLSAILGVVTVKLHEDTIRDLLIARIQAADGEQGVKDALIAKVKHLPADALGLLTTRGLDAAMSKVPDLLSLLQGLLP